MPTKLTILLTLALSSAQGVPFVAEEGIACPSTVVYSLVNNFGRGPVMTTGARVLQKTGLAEIQARQAAEKAYATIRNSTDDVARIAKTTGRTEAEIQQIKNHLFHDTHRLTRGTRRFDADPQIAAA